MSMPGNAPSSTFGSHSLAWPNNPGRRSPLIAALLSLLVPGLGQVYVGRPVRGAAWFVAILAVEAAVLYSLLHQPRFWMIALASDMARGHAVPDGEAAVLARRATHYQLQRYNKWYVYVALFAVGMALNVATCLALTRDAATPAGVHSINSSSMQPAIQRGDRFVADRNHYRRNEPARGDVAVYVHPRRPELLYVKRIVALAGDRVAIRDGRAIVNGFALEEPYAILGDPASLYNQTREITVPDRPRVRARRQPRQQPRQPRRQRSRPGPDREPAGAGDRYRLVADAFADRALDRHAVAAHVISQRDTPSSPTVSRHRGRLFRSPWRLFGNDRLVTTITAVRSPMPYSHDGGSRTSQESDMEGTLGRTCLILALLGLLLAVTLSVNPGARADGATVAAQAVTMQLQGNAEADENPRERGEDDGAVRAGRAAPPAQAGARFPPG